LHSEGNTTNSYLYAGEQRDTESGNYYLRARYFSPLRGGFTQMDTYAGNNQDPITLHKYLYANANPVSNIDPTGRFSMMSLSNNIAITGILAGVRLYSFGSTTYDIYNGDFDYSVFGLASSFLGGRLINGFLKKHMQWLEDRMKWKAKRKKKRDPDCPFNSFDGTTLVATENGLVPIEEIKIGDMVWAYNEANQTKSLQEVTHLIRGEGNKTLTDITLDSGEVITATSNHPFWTINTQNWTEAGELSVETVLWNINDKNSTISSLRSYTQRATVYNLTVANDHTYFVGVGGVLGHNSCSIEETKHVEKLLKKNKGWRQHYNKAIKLLREGKPGGNQHALSKDRKGEWAIDLGGSSGRGGNRIIYMKDDNKIIIKDIIDYH